MRRNFLATLPDQDNSHWIGGKEQKKRKSFRKGKHRSKKLKLMTKLRNHLHLQDGKGRNRLLDYFDFYIILS